MQTWKQLLDEYNKVRTYPYRSEPDREEAMRYEIEHVILVILERMANGTSSL